MYYLFDLDMILINLYLTLDPSAGGLAKCVFNTFSRYSCPSS